MKNIFLSITAVVALVGAILLAPGCASTGSTPSTTLTTNQVQEAQQLVANTVSSGLLILIANDKTNSVPYIRLADATVNAFIGGTNYSPAALQAALRAIPGGQLNSAYVALAVNVVVGAYEIYYAQYVDGQVNGNQYAAILLTGIDEGLNDAVALTPQQLKALKAPKTHAHVIPKS